MWNTSQPNILHESGKQLNQNWHAQLIISRPATQPQILIKNSELPIAGFTLGALIWANGLKDIYLPACFYKRTMVHLALNFSDLKFMRLYIQIQSLFRICTASLVVLNSFDCLVYMIAEYADRIY